MPNSQSFTAHFNICETFFCSQTIKITQIDSESAMGLGLIGCDLMRSHGMGWQVPDRLILMMIVRSGSQSNKPSNVKTSKYILSLCCYLLPFSFLKKTMKLQRNNHSWLFVTHIRDGLVGGCIIDFPDIDHIIDLFDVQCSLPILFSKDSEEDK